MSTNENNVTPRVTGLLILEVRKSNPNGDPERDGSPRQRPDGMGEISPVSVKRKLRDLVAEKDGVIWPAVKEKLQIQHDEQFQILESRGRDRASIKKLLENNFDAFKRAYWDGRVFGNTFLEENGPDTIRAGVCHFGVGVSIAPIEIEFSTWTSKSGVEADKDRGMAPMAFRVVKHGLYAVPFFVNPNLAHKTGCTKLDVDVVLHLLKHAFSNTRSVIRTMVEVIHAHTLTHKSRAGSVSDFAFVDALMPKKDNPDKPSISLTDYFIPQWTGEVAAKFGDRGEYKDYA
jgi:Cas7 group CRISPR-associated protein Csh2